MFKFMSLRSMKNITRRSWDNIPITDTVIDRVNLLGKDQQELLVFTACKGQTIGDGDVELTEVDGDGDGDGDGNEAPIKLKIKMILAIKRIKTRSILSRRTKPLFNKP